ncbi:recombination regulator RecX [Shewanella sp. JM162201]|uniref:Regulatory protein RecX n=1 Tax=Shewanella jiangmenensis TaxID=2837387 RepID=A0ABS5UYZ7_9GAMM|nr:regulatory protein RecX [Shewanella jiangmenensis]MBT1443367.1 recombination regulator RecX [Shewanella jiangmenensis]
MKLALALLARRDHGRAELKVKLIAKGCESIAADKALDDCEARGYLCDSRVGNSVLRTAVAKGQGLARAKQAMIAKGLDKEVIAQSLDASDVDWYALARAKALKKFGAGKPVDAKDRARRVRYLVGQGFGFDQISKALDVDTDAFDCDSFDGDNPDGHNLG